MYTSKQSQKGGILPGQRPTLYFTPHRVAAPLYDVDFGGRRRRTYKPVISPAQKQQVHRSELQNYTQALIHHTNALTNLRQEIQNYSRHKTLFAMS